ncbi:peptidyl-prolyl cis-trans isomerase [Thalictrum thalictroides]|uniref:Peptidyl-prolyl cis-trans isomerase n=1 Tax=Thalictrum thalictroides TaxID=46969 RepID=A0A7J6VUB0_THATH|nr:peptidyl-prolyl cis-trans isomerase [Thalictrum thalictroides]
MGRKPNDPETSRWVFLVLLTMGVISCSLVYMVLSSTLKPKYYNPSISNFDSSLLLEEEESGRKVGTLGFLEEEGDCCRGIEKLELWGAAVKWGSEFKFNSSEECCRACKSMCTGKDGPCLCDSWVFCGNKEACGSKFGECWLKKQKDTLAPERQDSGGSVIWTSGVIFGKGEGIVGLGTEYGTLHIKLFPECAPYSVEYILDLLGMRHCAGCHFYRAEGRGYSWDSEGNHIKDAGFGPPFALIQGTLEAEGTAYRGRPKEACPSIRRGSVAWVDSGPEFFISLANHNEWRKDYTVFGAVLPEDMEIAEKIANLPTKADVWNNVNVSVLEKPVPLWFQRIKSSAVNLKS